MTCCTFPNLSMLLAAFTVQDRVDVVVWLWSQELSLGTPFMSRGFRISALGHYLPVYVQFEAHYLFKMHV